MKSSSFEEFFRKAEESLTYQVEGSIIDFTEDLCRVMEEKGVSRAELARRSLEESWPREARYERLLSLIAILGVLKDLQYPLIMAC